MNSFVRLEFAKIHLSLKRVNLRAKGAKLKQERICFCILWLRINCAFVLLSTLLEHVNMYINDVIKIVFRTSTVQIAPLIAVIVRTAGHVLQTRVCVQMAVRTGGPGTSAL